MKTVAVIGLGYIGLPTAAVLADHGFTVVGVDNNPRITASVNRKECHIAEPGLAELVGKAVESGRLHAVEQPVPADIFVIAVPTPLCAESRRPDLFMVESAFSSIVPVLKANDIVILESTSPVGTSERMARILSEKRPDLRIASPASEECDVFVAFCPERILPGNALSELIVNDRVVGGINAISADKAADFYRSFIKGQVQKSTARMAEMAKLTENAFRDTNIAFANELSLLCHRFGLDVWELIDLANRHPRVNILRPGPGVGGHCVAVDPWFIIDQAPDCARIMRAARDVNDAKAEWVAEQVMRKSDEILAERAGKAPVTIALLGLAFKPDVGDLRESPAVRIADRLAKEPTISLRLVEPHVETPPPALSGERLWDYESAVSGADIVLLLVPHRCFGDLGERLEKPTVLLNFVNPGLKGAQQ